MTQQGFDPFGEEEASTAKGLAEDEPLENLLAPTSSDWDPVAEDESWNSPAPIGDLESLLLEGPDNPSGVYPARLHHNPLPDEFGLPPQENPAAEVEQRVKDGQEALPQSGETTCTDAEIAPLNVPREALPSRADAPSVPVPVESRPIAWIVPGVVFFGGVGAGLYVFAAANTILGAIAIALSMVGSLFLRVLLKQ